MTIVCIIGTNGIAQPSTGGAPVQSGDPAVTAYQIDEAGNVRSLGGVVPYNISTSESVPAGALATLGRSVNGRFYCKTWSTQTNPGAVNPNAVYQPPANAGGPAGF